MMRETRAAEDQEKQSVPPVQSPSASRSEEQTVHWPELRSWGETMSSDELFGASVGSLLLLNSDQVKEYTCSAQACSGPEAKQLSSTAAAWQGKGKRGRPSKAAAAAAAAAAGSMDDPALAAAAPVDGMMQGYGAFMGDGMSSMFAADAMNMADPAALAAQAVSGPASAPGFGAAKGLGSQGLDQQGLLLQNSLQMAGASLGMGADVYSSMGAAAAGGSGAAAAANLMRASTMPTGMQEGLMDAAQRAALGGGGEVSHPGSLPGAASGGLQGMLAAAGGSNTAAGNAAALQNMQRPQYMQTLEQQLALHGMTKKRLLELMKEDPMGLDVGDVDALLASMDAGLMSIQGLAGDVGMSATSQALQDVWSNCRAS
ncbi:hypothetical protein OEZ85_013035 [Tetradesmus obliquus]|uniref:Uncharacterized protein n=1 Tax=Tetradesmus obliquus TaxID=3088 RepID=A0ABY8U8G7_TETOB|nr:hypothetical protein OEZ85_013035 [Tetradesmus obliquus]